MRHVRGHQLPIQNGNHNLRSSSGYEKIPVWPGNEGVFQNNARNLTRKFQESFHATGGYNNGPAPKKRRETNFNNAYNFNNGLPFARRLEDSACSSWVITDNLAFTGRDESSCSIAGFNSSSALARKAEESICHSASLFNEPILRRVEGSNSTVGSNSEGSDHYLSRAEIERCSPSRKDGIDLQKETYFRYSYCAFLQTLGMRLQLPQTTIATAMVYCHRFFLRRSHASNDRFLIASAAMFLAAKSEETPCPLNSVLIVSYEICHKNDLANFHYLLPPDWFEQYKQQVLQAEQLILTTLDFELTVQHPYNPLMLVFNKIGLAQTVLVHVAWNLVSEGGILDKGFCFPTGEFSFPWSCDVVVCQKDDLPAIFFYRFGALCVFSLSLSILQLERHSLLPIFLMLISLLIKPCGRNFRLHQLYFKMLYSS